MLLKSSFANNLVQLAVLHAAAYKQKLIESWKESSHPSGTVVVLFAPPFHLLLPENNEARKTQVLFHLSVLKDTVDEDVLPALNTEWLETKYHKYRPTASSRPDLKLLVQLWDLNLHCYKETSSKVAKETPSAARGTAGHPCPSGVISLSVSQNDSFFSQDLVA